MIRGILPHWVPLAVPWRAEITREEKLDDKIDVVTRGLLGLTVSCARCHDHKFDPIPTRDYSLFTIFANTREPEELHYLMQKRGNDNRYTLELSAERRRVAEEIAKLREARFPALKALYRTAQIARLLVGVAESSGLKTEVERGKFAREKDLNPFLLERWRSMVNELNLGDLAPTHSHSARKIHSRNSVRGHNCGH
jgi:hypothetical protein